MSYQHNQHNVFKNKKILFLRHGQAAHNPRAEEAKDNGCSHDTFLNLMKEDDKFDAELTELGEKQAMDGRIMHQNRLTDVDLVVSSPLSRAMKTADLTLCPERGVQSSFPLNATKHPKRICLEELREINGWLLNAKRRSRTDLKKIFHDRWDFDVLSEEDETWTEEMESYADCGERGYQAFLWLLRRNEKQILVVSHGGILRFTMVDHPLVKLIDGRSEDAKRFNNCELRGYEISYDTNAGSPERPIVILTEIKH